MKKLALALVILVVSFAQGQVLSLCGDVNNTSYSEFCNRMKHLRSTINIMDQQRDMVLVNYDLISLLGKSLTDNSERLLQVTPKEMADHVVALRALGFAGHEISELAKNKNADVFRVANNARTECLTCHTTGRTRAGNSSWAQVFNMDWNKIISDCNAADRNPYLCKNMNGMATAYNHLSTAYDAKIQDFEITAGVTSEVVRILKELKLNNFLHMAEGLRQNAQMSAEEVIALAKDKNPDVFEKTTGLTASCNLCHSADVNGDPKPMHYQLWQR